MAFVHDRLLNGVAVGEHPHMVYTNALNGTLGLNTYPSAFAAVPFAPGDVEGNGTVGVGDVLALIDAWGPCDPPCLQDLDANGSVDVDDLLIVLSH